MSIPAFRVATESGQVGRRLISAAATVAVLCVMMAIAGPRASNAKSSNGQMQVAAGQKVIIDTDIGIDIDDAFAVALVLRSPELNILGFSTASGDTTGRARIIDRILGETGRSDNPVVVGPATAVPDQPPGLIGPQKRYEEHGHYVRESHPPAIEYILEQIRRFPGQITLVAIGPLSNIGAMIEKDVDTFRKLKRVVMMGGWVRPLAAATGQTNEPAPEYNILIDIPSAQKLFASGVPIYMLPLDSTVHLALDEARRRSVFSEGAPLTDALALLYVFWGGTTPILYDAWPSRIRSIPSSVLSSRRI